MRSIRMLVVLLVLVGAACGDDDATTATTAGSGTTAGTTPATTTTAGPVTTAGAVAAATVDLDDVGLYLEPADLSYRMTLLFHFSAQTDSGMVDGTEEVDGGKILDPAHFELTGRAEGDATGPQCFEFHTLPGFVDPYETFLNEGGMLMGDAGLGEAGITVNGRVVDRYTITMSNVDPADDAGSEVDELTEAYLDIDREGRFVVQ